MGGTCSTCEIRNTCNYLVNNPAGTRPLGGSGLGAKIILKYIFKNTGV
jgi:hypothetical protein